MRASTELEHHRRQPQRLDRPCHRRSLVGELREGRADEHAQPLIRRANDIGGLRRHPHNVTTRSRAAAGKDSGVTSRPLRVAVMSTQTPPDTIVLIHGFWVTPRSWEDWIAYYENKGFNVLAPAYPGFDVEVEALNADPTPIEKVTVAQIMERLEGVVGGLDQPPILMGHSAGGVFTQLLMDRGYGAVGVAINSAPTEGVKRVPLSQARATFPVLKNPANRHKAVGFTFKQWQYAFTNTFTEERGPRTVRPLPHSCVGTHLLGERPGQHPSGQGRHPRRLQEPESCPAAVHLGQRRQPHAADAPAVEREALRGRGHHHRREGVRGTAPAAIDRGLGGGRRLRARLGAQPRQD